MISFAQEWPKTQLYFRRRISTDSSIRGAWQLFLDGMKDASIRSHKTSRTGNHMDIRVNWCGKVRQLHIEARHFDGPYIAQYVLGGLVEECLPLAKTVIEACASDAKQAGNFEFASPYGISVAEVVLQEADRLGLRFARELAEYAHNSRSAPVDAKRKHARDSALADAKKFIKIAIQNGLSPDEVITFVNECVCEEVLTS